MSKAVPTDHEFNRYKFAALLKNAKGNRSQTQYAQDCGLSVSHLNRYFNGKMEQPPVPSTIIKLAGHAQNGITCEDLLDAAGYNPEQHFTEVDHQLTSDPFGGPCLAQIITRLTQCDFEWTDFILIPQIKGVTGAKCFDFSIDIENTDVLNRWYFEIRDLSAAAQDASILHYIYGQICTLEISPKTKISLVVESDDSFNMVKEHPPLALSFYFSVILYDQTNDVIVKEEYLPTALELPDDLTSNFTLIGGN